MAESIRKHEENEENEENIEKTLIQERKDEVVSVQTVNGSWKEPATKYGAVFPYNKVLREHLARSPVFYKPVYF